MQTPAESPSPELKYLLAAFITPCMWGFVSIPFRLIQSYPAEQILFYRVLFSALLLGLLILCWRRKRLITDIHYVKSLPAPARRKFLLLSLLATLFITGNWYFYIYVVNHVSLQSAAFAYMVCPLITAIGGCLLLKEKLTTLQWIAISISFLSIIFLGLGFLRDMLWSILIASVFTGYLFVQRLLHQVDKFVLLSAQLIVSTLLIIPYTIMQGDVLPIDPVFWMTIFLIALFFTTIPLCLNTYALVKVPSCTIGIFIYMNPIIAFIIAFFYFSESVSLLQIAAYSVLLLAVILFNIPMFRRRHI